MPPTPSPAAPPESPRSFFCPLPISRTLRQEPKSPRPARAFQTPCRQSRTGKPRTRVVNLTGAFAATHPSGLETETLTVLSLCGTLHANLPRVTEVRFLVDGQPRATLAGHADLTRTYLAGDAAPTEGAHP
jgi:hypothetical protein